MIYILIWLLVGSLTLNTLFFMDGRCSPLDKESDLIFSLLTIASGPIFFTLFWVYFLFLRINETLRRK